MIETLAEWDLNVFFAIHHGWRGEFTDLILPLCRNKYFWVPLYIFFFSFLTLNFGKRGFYLILYVLLGVILTDQLSSQIIKPLVGRDRPCKEITLIDEVEALVRCGSGKSFPSSHAANHFGIAMILGLALFRRWPKLIWIMVSWATLISLAQVFVGVHYPSDILFGALIGVLVGWFLGGWFDQAMDYL